MNEDRIEKKVSKLYVLRKQAKCEVGTVHYVTGLVHKTFGKLYAT